MHLNNIKMFSNNNFSHLLAGIGAFTIWGFLALFWYPLREMLAQQILAYRIIFSVLTLLPIVYFYHKFEAIKHAFLSPKTLGLLSLSSLLIGANWYLYIWAVLNGKILEVSMGYYITPLFNVLFGAIIFKERLAKLQILAILIAFIGVLWSVVTYGKFPYISFLVAINFSLYSLIRKMITVDPLTGLFIETTALLPLALAWLLFNCTLIETSFFSLNISLQLLLISTGFVTSVPLLLFAFAAKGLKLSTLGIIQYISPSLNFLVGIFVIGEKISTNTLITFICIWIALCVYTYSALKNLKQRT